MKNKNIVLSVCVIICFVLVCVFLINNSKSSIISQDSQEESSVLETLCFYQETIGEGASVKIVDKNLITVNFDTTDKSVGSVVSGIINWIPAEKDSSVGSYTGKIIKKDTEGTLFIDALNTSYGEGIKFTQQEIIKVTRDTASIGIGEKMESSSGVYVYKNLTDLNKLLFTNILSKVSCSSVSDNVNKDYTKEIK